MGMGCLYLGLSFPTMEKGHGKPSAPLGRHGDAGNLCVKRSHRPPWPRGWGGEGRLGVSDSRFELRSVSVTPSRPLRAMGGFRALMAALWALGAAGAAALRIGAFNIQSFGDSKVSDPACGGVIAQVRPGAGRRGHSWASPVIPPARDPAPAGPSPRSWLAMTSRWCRRCETRT